ncbi:hypothetical protein E4U09_000350 [Claviceps aff. purpurea]|uniref:Uncharacterized protein n=1 Tax=Claviceps aff. purpurea TaxID=1967640 RepID=A0A9P7TYN2_9HYPO|nr:hypothetical protein E4U09_000350 [Claviceps aff. purpurea]
MRDSVAALDRNAVALIESHNALAKEGALWRENDRRQKDMIGKLQLELARAMKQPVRATESDDTPCSDCENTRSERRVAEDLQRMSMNSQRARPWPFATGGLRDHQISGFLSRR